MMQKEMLVESTVFTVKKHNIVEIGLAARELNKAVVRDKTQMPNVKQLVDLVA